ncbi:MAG TPA: methyl-accepting chemotaxis protein [Deltaproteobacteria bacterium]|nr:methyl-accepting chemotaxis protein [Deltaproteobacteria bacterium]
MKVPIGYKFIFGFIAVVAVAAFAPDMVEKMGVVEWMRLPLGFLVAILIGLILGSVFTKRFTRDFSYLKKMTEKVSSGELDVNTEPRLTKKSFPDETTELERCLLQVFTNLRELVGHIKNTVEELGETQKVLTKVISHGEETAKQVITGTSQIFNGAIDQARHINTASEKIKEVSKLADQVAEKTTQQAASSQKVNTMVQRGVGRATSVIERFEEIFSGMEKMAKSVTELKEKLDDIPRVLDAITHISKQTDLLALNATIEATKTEADRTRFLTVAEEFRRFADNTSKSAKEVEYIVRELAKEIEKVVIMANEGTHSIKEGREDIRRIRDILDEITGYTAEVAEKATMVLSITERQKATSHETVSVIEESAAIVERNLKVTENVDRAVEKHQDAIEDTVKAAEKLSELSAELKNTIARFKL